jgi:tRNA(Arg) A34 adenosine deaminase TadA
MENDHRKRFMQRAAALAVYALENNLGGPFGAVVVKEGEIIGEGYNQVTSLNDPTAHAEMMAIRNACSRLGSFQLTNCEIYSSCEPCPMCLGAVYWARPDRLYYGSGREEAAEAGFDDAFIYEEIPKLQEERKIPFVFLPDEESSAVFRKWTTKKNKKEY